MAAAAKRLFLLLMARSSELVEARSLTSEKRPPVKVRLLISFEVSRPPSNTWGRMRLSLAFTTGSSGMWLPRRSSLLEARSLAVRPSLLYSSGVPPSSCTGSRSVPLVPRPESSLMPSMPRASRPKPTVPSV
ncbi:hypothetical protein D9M69_536430 [compost metagenome]